MGNTKKIKDMTKIEFQKYKRDKAKERYKKEKEKEDRKSQEMKLTGARLSNLTEEDQAWHKWCAKENKRKSRSSMTKEEVDYSRIFDRQRKRKHKKPMNEASEDGITNLLEWIKFYEESEENQKVMKRKNSEIYSLCKSHLENRSNKTEESDEKTNDHPFSTG